MVYSESEGKPQVWDQSQKGTVESLIFSNDDTNYINGMKFTHHMSAHQFVNLSLAEYVFVSTSLALVIAKFFPAVHNQIVSRATTLEHQSLYWGTAVVSNVFTYGLLFTAMRGWSIIEQNGFMLRLISYNNNNNNDKLLFVAFGITCAQEIVIYVILFVGAVIASLKTHPDANVPIPVRMAGTMINFSFCWSCFCCCVCCSPRCRAKTMRVLVLFSFMSFVYHSVMDGISVVFALFIEESRIITVTLTLLYISFLVFLVLFVSFSLLGLFRSKNNDVLCYRNFITCYGGLCMFIIVFPAIVLMLVMYMIIVFSLNLKGVTGIVTGLIPSIALSAASWYIKKRLGKEMSQSNTATSQSQYGTTGGTVNDGEREETEENTDHERVRLL